LVESPLDIAETVRTRMLGLPVVDVVAESHSGTGSGSDPDTADLPTATGIDRPRAWIFTSATLGDDAALRWFTEPCGLTDARVLRVVSPFDYAAQAAVYVPAHLPKPSDPGHARALVRELIPHIGRLGGRTLVLTTTLRALREIGDALAQGLMADGAVEVLVQGQWPKRYLMERFREADSQGRPGCVLVASASFWDRQAAFSTTW
jgi:ATP-dependent DNA helicase DinG